MSKIKKFSLSLVFAVCLLCVFMCGSAFADGAGSRYDETPVYIDGMLSVRGYEIGDTTYLPLESTCAVLGYEPQSDFNSDKNTLTVRVNDIEINVYTGEKYMSANGRYFYLPDGYMEIDGNAIVPLEVIAKIFTLETSWNDEVKAYDLSTANEQILESGETFYDEDDLYWMSRIITYESGNQPIEGQIGVGNVVLNRVESGRFANTVKDVIFQPGQFQPVDSGAIYMDPWDISVISAKLAFEGYNTVGNSLFFQQGGYSDWMNGNATWVIKIADHNFFA